MDDHAAITALILEYGERLDGGDLDGVAALFEHADWGSPARATPLHGAEQVRAAYEGVVLYDGAPATKHVITNVTVDVDVVASAATARSSFTVWQARPGFPLQPILAGRYHDRFERDPAGRWRFAARTTVPDFVGDLSRHMSQFQPPPGSSAAGSAGAT